MPQAGAVAGPNGPRIKAKHTFSAPRGPIQTPKGTKNSQKTAPIGPDDVNSLGGKEDTSNNWESKHRGRDLMALNGIMVSRGFSLPWNRVNLHEVLQGLHKVIDGSPQKLALSKKDNGRTPVCISTQKLAIDLQSRIPSNYFVSQHSDLIGSILLAAKEYLNDSQQDLNWHSMRSNENVTRVQKSEENLTVSKKINKANNNKGKNKKTQCQWAIYFQQHLLNELIAVTPQKYLKKGTKTASSVLKSVNNLLLDGVSGGNSHPKMDRTELSTDLEIEKDAIRVRDQIPAEFFVDESGTAMYGILRAATAYIRTLRTQIINSIQNSSEMARVRSRSMLLEVLQSGRCCAYEDGGKVIKEESRSDEEEDVDTFAEEMEDDLAPIMETIVSDDADSDEEYYETDSESGSDILGFQGIIKQESTGGRLSDNDSFEDEVDVSTTVNVFAKGKKRTFCIDEPAQASKSLKSRRIQARKATTLLDRTDPLPEAPSLKIALETATREIGHYKEILEALGMPATEVPKVMRRMENGETARRAVFRYS